MARFVKGQSGNPAGPIAGAKTRTAETIREGIRRFLYKNLSKLQQDFDKLNGTERLRAKERLLIYEKFLSHVLPKPEFDLSKLSEKDLDILIERLKEKQLPNCQNSGFKVPVKPKELINN